MALSSLSWAVRAITYKFVPGKHAESPLYPAAMLRDECPVSIALRVIAGKWKPLILRELKSGSSLRYGQLQRRIPEASQKVLTSQLRQLERDGLVERTIYHETILRTQYALSPYGRTLRPALLELARWGQKHSKHSVARREGQIAGNAVQP
jgi:DNA-binding HxlR family transcriptional regulator